MTKHYCCLEICFAVLLVFELVSGNVPHHHEDSVKFIVSYPIKIRGEYDLPLCNSTFSPCNILELRFWRPMLIQRQCLCPARTTCPFNWSNNDSDNSTVWISNRSQMKFCAPVNLETCSDSPSVAAAELSTFSEMVSPREYARLDSDDTRKSLAVVHKDTVLFCICPRRRYWSPLGDPVKETGPKNVVVVKQKFSCALLDYCYQGDFCGHIRADLFSTYHRCFCPPGHLCVFDTDRNTTHVDEFHFQGPALSGQCLLDDSEDRK
ncbi:unnamed protein product [Notodromas monacha]|uniref:Uncharacterized protein n=1 Tax=Notodromas monacha TaxID=399045 RepID=A0A7R9BHX3_9CRUS|nr:unnamed protein product [Notodromas monacha]CAG0915816.1 unnamed protein product [Notodromas monacha]